MCVCAYLARQIAIFDRVLCIHTHEHHVGAPQPEHPPTHARPGYKFAKPLIYDPTASACARWESEPVLVRAHTNDWAGAINTLIVDNAVARGEKAWSFRRLVSIGCNIQRVVFAQFGMHHSRFLNNALAPTKETRFGNIIFSFLHATFRSLNKFPISVRIHTAATATSRQRCSASNWIRGVRASQPAYPVAGAYSTHTFANTLIHVYICLGNKICRSGQV